MSFEILPYYNNILILRLIRLGKFYKWQNSSKLFLKSIISNKRKHMNFFESFSIKWHGFACHTFGIGKDWHTAMKIWGRVIWNAFDEIIMITPITVSKRVI